MSRTYKLYTLGMLDDREALFIVTPVVKRTVYITTYYQHNQGYVLQAVTNVLRALNRDWDIITGNRADFESDNAYELIQAISRGDIELSNSPPKDEGVDS